MTVKTHLVTGVGANNHITSDDMQYQNAYTFGKENLVFELTGSMPTSNTFTVSKGALMLNGVFIRQEVEESLEVSSGTQGQSRRDLVCMKYHKDQSTGVETASLHIVEGTSGSTSDPTVATGSVLDGALDVDFPLFRIKLEGINVSFEPLFVVYTPRPYFVVKSLPTTGLVEGAIYYVEV